MTNRYRARLDELEDALPFTPDIEAMIDRLAVDEHLSPNDLRIDMQADRRRFRGLSTSTLADRLAEELGCTPDELLDDASTLVARYGA